MNISRRSILAGASSFALTPALLGKRNTPAANDRIAVGFIGVGARAQELLQATMQLPGVEVAGIVDAYQGRIERALERTNQRPKVYENYRELLAQKSIDAVVVATPDHWHAAMVTDALRSGKDVYCEKPLTYKAAEGPQIIQTVRDTGRILQVGSQGMSSAIQRKAKELIQSGRLGQITMVRAAYNRNTASGAWIYPIPPDANAHTVNWQMFLGDTAQESFSLERFFRWRCYWDYSGGIATDLFVHLCTTIHFLLDAKMPSRAVALGELYRWKSSRNVPDTLNGVLEYPEGFAVNLSSTLNNESSSQASFQILGTHGTLSLGKSLVFTPENPHGDDRWILDSWPQKLEDSYYRDPKRQAEMPDYGTPRIIGGSEQFREEGEDATLIHLSHFFDSVRSREPYWEDATQGHHAAACAHMINRAVRKRQTIEWNFEKDDIEG